MVIDGRFVDTGSMRDFIHAGTGKADFGKHLRRGI
jgi:hypothetical protein